MGKLTATGVKAAKGPGRYGDGQGLFLILGKGGSASWIVRLQKNGRRRDIGLGSAAKVSLSRARQLAVEVRSQVEAGIDPVMERRKALGIPTFSQAAECVFDANRGRWSNEKHLWQWKRSMEMFVYPAIGNVSVGAVTAAQVHDLLAAIWLEKPETARRVRQRIGMVLDWAFSKGYRETEAPLRSITKGLPRQPRNIGHHAAMSFVDVPAFLARLNQKETWGRLALEAAILTAARSGEVRGAKWPEVDLEKGLWTVPAERMKARKEHVVPLSPAALSVFKRAENLRTEGCPFIFNGAKRDKPMSDMTLIKVLRDMGESVTAHGFRSSFRDWVSEETRFPSDLAEAALAHTVKNKTERAYRRGNLLEKRRELMNAWGSFCSNVSNSIKVGNI